jgi:hypothetical protein
MPFNFIYGVLSFLNFLIGWKERNGAGTLLVLTIQYLSFVLLWGDEEQNCIIKQNSQIE